MSIPALNPDVIRRGLDAAIEQAEKSWKEGGIPIGSVLVKDGSCRHHEILDI